MAPRSCPSLAVVRLSSARWHCDAPAAAWIRSWMASTGVELVGAGEILCRTPPDLRGRSLLTRGRSLLTVADWELGGELPTVPVVFRVPTTARPGRRHSTTGHGRSPLDWPRRPEFLDEHYADSVDVEFRSAVYDDDAPDWSYDVADSRGDALRPSEDARSSSTPSPSGSAELALPVLERLRLTGTTYRTSTVTSREEAAHHAVAPQETETRWPPSAGGGGPNHVVLLTTLTIVATLAVAVFVVVAIAMMTRGKAARRTEQRPTSIELKTATNGSVRQNVSLRSASNCVPR